MARIGQEEEVNVRKEVKEAGGGARRPKGKLSSEGGRRNYFVSFLLTASRMKRMQGVVLSLRRPCWKFPLGKSSVVTVFSNVALQTVSHKLPSPTGCLYSGEVGHSVFSCV